MPESALHLRLRTALFLILDQRLGGQAYVGSDQFVYWDPTNPKACLAPDAFVRFGGPRELLPSYKAWEHGAPHVAVEILSSNDRRDRELEKRLERYRRCGVGELVIFDPENRETLLRLWDLVDGDLVERDLGGPAALRSDALHAYWYLQPHERLGALLRLAEAADGSGLWPTPEEAQAAEREKAQAERDQERATAERRIAELEAELRRRAT